MLGILIALLSGALMSIQGVFNTGITKQTSIWLASAWVAFSSFIVSIILWMIFERSESGVMDLFKVDNKYMLAGGAIGAFITWSVIKAMAELKPAQAVMLIVISQLIIAYLIELFGLFEVTKADFQWSKLFGILLSIAGFILFKWK